MAKLAKITAPDGWSYTFTNEDRLWAIRMLVGEAGAANWDQRWKQMEGEAILWSMLNRQYLLKRNYPTYTQMILAYSQPINPKWRNRGTPEQQLRRAYIASMPETAAPPQVVDLVTRFMQGTVSGEPYAGLAHFIAPGETPAPEAIGPVAIPGMRAQSNVFFKVAPTSSWSGDMLRFSSMIAKPKGVLYATISIGALVGVIAWYYLNKDKRR